MSVNQSAAVGHFLTCLVKSAIDPFATPSLIENARHPIVRDALREKTLQGKSIGAGTTDNGGVPPARYALFREVFLALVTSSIFGRLSGAFRRIPFHKKVGREFGSGAASSWRDEGTPAPVVLTQFDDSFSLAPHCRQTISVVTKESVAFQPVAEQGLRDALIAAVSRDIDAALLDPSSTTGSPSLTSIGSAVTSSGTSASNVLSDLEKMLGEIATSGDALRWVMRPLTFARIAAKLASVGFPVTPGNLLGIPCVLGSTSPQQITLLDCASIAAAFDDAIAVSVAGHASIEMLDTALQQDGTTGTGASLVSLWQSGLVGLSAEFNVSWASAYFREGSPAQAAGVVYMTTTY